jgi:hypothetical protein
MLSEFLSRASELGVRVALQRHVPQSRWIVVCVLLVLELEHQEIIPASTSNRLTASTFFLRLGEDVESLLAPWPSAEARHCC